VLPYGLDLILIHRIEGVSAEELLGLVVVHHP
jgi:hypothetical protein